jgi:hypothetical protein
LFKEIPQGKNGIATQRKQTMEINADCVGWTDEHRAVGTRVGLDLADH